MVKKERMRYTHTVRFVQFASICSAIAALAVSGSAAADVQHVVARGHTLSAIASRYHVTVKAIVDANHLRDPGHLRAGQTLTIPGVSANPTPHLDAHGRESMRLLTYVRSTLRYRPGTGPCGPRSSRDPAQTTRKVR